MEVGEYLDPLQFRAALALTPGNTFSYYVGWLPNGKKALEQLRHTAQLAWEASERGEVCLTQRKVLAATLNNDPIYDYRATIVRPEFRRRSKQPRDFVF